MALTHPPTIPFPHGISTSRRPTIHQAVDSVLRSSPARHSACRTQVDVRLCFLSHPSRYSQSITLSYKDFSECFPLWCEEQPNGAEGVFNTVSSFIETHIVVRFSHSIHIHPTQLLTLRLAYAPFPPGRATFFPPLFRDGNSRPTQINCSNSMTSRKT